MKHLPLRECGYAIVGLVAPILLYGGAYLAMISRAEAKFRTPPPGNVLWRLSAEPPEVDPPIANYRFGAEWAIPLFAPAHELDRRIRSEYWDSEYAIAILRTPYPRLRLRKGLP